MTLTSAFWSTDEERDQQIRETLRKIQNIKLTPVEHPVEPPRITHVEILRQEVLDLNRTLDRVPTIVNLSAQGMLTGVCIMGAGCWAFTPLPLSAILAVCSFAAYFVLSLWGCIRFWLRYL